MKKVINRRNLPPKLPLTHYAVIWLLLDKFNAPEWAMGIYWFVAVIVVIAEIVTIFKVEYVDIFD